MEIGNSPFDTPLKGMNRALTKLETAAKSLSAAARQPEQPLQDMVDLSGQAVTLIRARNEFKANVEAFETQDEMTRKTLDLVG